LVDLEERKPVDLLEGSKASTFAEWLSSHPEVELISRDRGGAYADAAREAAPQAVQVVDRWHLLKNLSEHLERFVDGRRSLVERAAEDVRARQVIDTSLGASPEAMLSSKTDAEKRAHRQKRYERYLKVIELRDQGFSERAISGTLRVNRGTVRKFLHAGGFPERGAHKRQGSILDPYIPCIHRRWAEGCENAHQLWREIRGRGYEGAATRAKWGWFAGTRSACGGCWRSSPQSSERNFFPPRKPSKRPPPVAPDGGLRRTRKR
jgi:transposase